MVDDLDENLVGKSAGMSAAMWAGLMVAQMVG